MLQDRVAVVTGVSRINGIGHACCIALLQRGAFVVGIDSEPLAASSPLALEGSIEPRASSVSSEPAIKRPRLPELGDVAPGRFRFLQASITDATAVAAGIAHSLEALGCNQIHVLVNNAGIADPYMPSPDEADASTRIARFGELLSVNLAGAFAVTEACRPWFPVSKLSQQTRASPGCLPPRSARLLASVVHISSTRARQSEPHSEGYAASKAGLVGLTHAQAASLAGCARVNAVLPGWIDTSERERPDAAAVAARQKKSFLNLSADAAHASGDSNSYGDDVRAEDHAWHAVRRVGLPEDVAEMVAFLANPDAAGFVTGGEFVVDGGVSKRMAYPEDDDD